MFKKLLKLGAYLKAPKLTFALLHPIKMLKLATLGGVFALLFGRGKRRPRARTSRPNGRHWKLNQGEPI